MSAHGPGITGDCTLSPRLAFRDERRTCLLVASGPTAADADLHAWRGIPTVVVNDAWRLAPWADCLYAADWQWWNVHAEAVAAGFTGERYSSSWAGLHARGLKMKWPTHPQVRHVVVKMAAGLSHVHGTVYSGGVPGNSGAQALNLAYLAGARTIILVGFDMRPADDGRLHFFGNHPRPLANVDNYDAFRAGFGRLAVELHAAGVAVLNASPRSALTCFQRAKLERCRAFFS